MATPQLNAGTRDYGRGSLSRAISNVTMSFNGGGGGEDGSISGAPKCFEYEGPLLARKKKFRDPPHINPSELFSIYVPRYIPKNYTLSPGCTYIFCMHLKRAIIYLHNTN